MSSSLLESSKSKIKRAETHIKDLHAALVSYWETQPCERVVDFNADHTQKRYKYRFKQPVPAEISAIAGDAAHNLRSTLDHLAVAFAALHQRRAAETITDSGAHFPFGKDRTIFETALLKKEKMFSPEALKFFNDLKPYPGGNDLLFSLHDLDLMDKHRLLVPIILTPRGFSIDDMTIKGGVYHSPLSRPIWDPNDNSITFLVTAADAEVQYKMQYALDIAFREVKPLEGQPVLAVLHQLRNLVIRIVELAGRKILT